MFNFSINITNKTTLDQTEQPQQFGKQLGSLSKKQVQSTSLIQQMPIVSVQQAIVGKPFKVQENNKESIKKQIIEVIDDFLQMIDVLEKQNDSIYLIQSLLTKCKDKHNTPKAQILQNRLDGVINDLQLINNQQEGMISQLDQIIITNDDQSLPKSQSLAQQLDNIHSLILNLNTQSVELIDELQSEAVQQNSRIEGLDEYYQVLLDIQQKLEQQKK